MLLARILAFAAAGAMVASPVAAADLSSLDDVGARRSGADFGVYLGVPFGGRSSGRAQAGLRLSAAHDFRDARAPSAPVIRSDALDLRLVGDSKPSFYVAGQKVTGEGTRRLNLFGGPSIVTVAVLSLAAIGAIVIYKEIDDDDSALD